MHSFWSIIDKRLINTIDAFGCLFTCIINHKSIFIYQSIKKCLPSIEHKKIKQTHYDNKLSLLILKERNHIFWTYISLHSLHRFSIIGCVHLNLSFSSSEIYNEIVKHCIIKKILNNIHYICKNTVTFWLWVLEKNV